MKGNPSMNPAGPVTPVEDDGDAVAVTMTSHRHRPGTTSLEDTVHQNRLGASIMPRHLDYALRIVQDSR